MEDLLAARWQMAITLGFHILFAVVGMAMPALMVVAELLHLKTKDAVYKDLALRWAKGTAILFAVGAVSGTALSFELGLLWPRFMEAAGPLVGLPFTLEGFAFFLEAIFLGVYLYGWDKVSPRMHIFAGAAVAISGVMSGVFVVAVNGFMNMPQGFVVEGDRLIASDPWAAFLNPAFPTEALHMALAAYSSVAFVVLGIHAWRLLQRPDSAFHQRALGIAFGFAAVTAPLMLLSGDLAAKHIAEHQPSKLAAAEGLFETERGAGLTIIGWPDVKAREVIYDVKIPYALSVLAFLDPNAEVKGLDQVPLDEQPPIVPVFIAFRIMIGCGMAMIALAVFGVFLLARKRRLSTSRPFLIASVLCAPLGLIAVEAGWTVTEVGRQPWILRGLMRTADAVTPLPNLWIHLASFTALYLALGAIVVVLLRAHVFRVDEEKA